MKMNHNPLGVAWAGRLWGRLKDIVRPAPTAATVRRVESALPGSMAQVRPPESFRQQLGQSLGMAAHSRTVGVTIQSPPRWGRWALFTSAAAIALSVTGLALLMRRLAR